MGNEAIGDRPWIRKILYPEIYSRALTDQEIRSNYFAGLASETTLSKRQTFASEGIVVRYLFEEGKGDIIGNDSYNDLSMDPHIPDKILSYERVHGFF